MEWINVKDRLPEQPIFRGARMGFYWVWDGEELFLAEWGHIDCNHNKRFADSNGCWFGDVDGTECFSAHENVTHWGDVDVPKPPEKP